MDIIIIGISIMNLMSTNNYKNRKNKSDFAGKKNPNK